MPANDFHDCGHDPRTEMRAFDSLPVPVRRAVREMRFEWCAVAVLAFGFRCYSEAKRRLGNQERAYMREGA